MTDHRARTPGATVAAVLAIAALAVMSVLTACGIDGGPASASEDGSNQPPILEQDELVIGVTPDQPNIGDEAQEDVYEGLDVDIATYLAKQLGYDETDLNFIPAPADTRQALLLKGKADLIVATYSVTPASKTKVQFAGPYYVARQDIVVRSDNQSIENVRDLEGVRVCNARGSDSWRNIVARGVEPIEVPASGWAECLLRLKIGDAEAVSADDAIIAGYMRYRSEGLKLVDAPFAEERWGVGLRRQDIEACERINRAIAKMYLNGTAVRFQRAWFDQTGLRLNTSVPQFEGCG